MMGFQTLLVVAISAAYVLAQSNLTARTGAVLIPEYAWVRTFILLSVPHAYWPSLVVGSLDHELERPKSMPCHGVPGRFLLQSVHEHGGGLGR
jgi:hypothetical protein